MEYLYDVDSAYQFNYADFQNISNRERLEIRLRRVHNNPISILSVAEKFSASKSLSDDTKRMAFAEKCIADGNVYAKCADEDE